MICKCCDSRIFLEYGADMVDGKVVCEECESPIYDHYGNPIEDWDTFFEVVESIDED